MPRINRMNSRFSTGCARVFSQGMLPRVMGIQAMGRRFTAFAFSVTLCGGIPIPEAARADDAVTRSIRSVMEENLAACDAEDLPRVLATMSEEMPNREAFIEETKREWAITDRYTRLVELEVLKHSKAPHANTRLPYATVRVVQTMIESERNAGERPTDLSQRMSLSQSSPTVEYETLWKKEGGKWRLVAGLTNPRPVGGSK